MGVGPEEGAISKGDRAAGTTLNRWLLGGMPCAIKRESRAWYKAWMPLVNTRAMVGEVGCRAYLSEVRDVPRMAADCAARYAG